MTTAKQDLQSLRDEFGALTAEVTRLMEASDQGGSDELKNRISQIHAKFERAVSGAADDKPDAIREFSENVADIVEDSLRDRPIATISIALGLGFLVGVALRR